MATASRANDNPFDLSFRPWDPEEVLDLRQSLWISRKEMSENPTWTAIYPSIRQMASRIGIHHKQWSDWEKNGVPGGSAWPALLRIYEEEEGREIYPVACTIAELLDVRELVENWEELALALNVYRTTLNKWRFVHGVVPAKFGYGRLVRIIHEDCIG